MNRFGIYFRIKPGKREEYIRRYAEVWAQMRAVLHEAGYRNYSIWNLGDDLFAYYEMSDLARAERVLDPSAIYA